MKQEIEKEETMPKQILTMTAIAEQHPDEWVLLANPVSDGFRVQRGELIYHSQHKDDVYKKLFTVKLKSAGIFWIGKIPEDLVVVL
jgi:hypothetical protein